MAYAATKTVLAYVFAPITVTRYCCPVTTPVMCTLPRTTFIARFPKKLRSVEDPDAILVPLLRKAVAWRVLEACIEPEVPTFRNADPEKEAGMEVVKAADDETGVTMTSWTSASAVPLFMTLNEREPLLRVEKRVAWVLELAWKKVNHASPDRSAFTPTLMEMETEVVCGTDVAAADALRMNWGLEALPAFMMKVLRSTTAAAVDEVLTFTLVCDWAVTVVEATVATYSWPLKVVVAESMLSRNAS